MVYDRRLDFMRRYESEVMLNGNEWGPPRHILRWFLLAVVIFAVVSIAFFFIFRPLSGGYYYPFYPPFFFPFGWIFGFFWIFVIFWVLRWVFMPWRGGYRRRYWRNQDGAYSILRERYAKGEITKEQFEQMMQDLDKHS